MNELKRYFDENRGRLIHKWSNFFDIYEAHFSRFRGKKITILEIGVSHGGSLQMWKQYFGPQAKIYGIDINPACKELEEENIQIFIGSQTDRQFLRNIVQKVPEIDILIDDGGHTMQQQIVSFQELYPHVAEEGVYLCEDIHTSYWLTFGGGYRRRGTFVEFSKKLIDQLNAFSSRQKALLPESFTRTTNSIHFYDGIIVFEKKVHPKPVQLKTGHYSFDLEKDINEHHLKKDTFKYKLIKYINLIFRYFRMHGFIWR